MPGNIETTLNQIRLLVDDFPAAFRFYRDVVGLAVGSGTEDDVYASFNAGGTEVALFRRDLMQQAIGQDVSTPGEGLGSIVVVFEVADVDATWKRMRDANAIGLAPPTDRPDWGIRTAQFRDPAGNIIEFFAGLA